MTIKPSYILTLSILIFSFFGCKQEKQIKNSLSENIVFQNKKADIVLSGTLSLPSKEGAFPAVILISGNGKHNRNEEFGPFKPFLDISNYFTERGIAVLRYDKRGVGKSTGEYDMASSFDFADDVHAAIHYLLSRKEINKNQIGLVGHSEGGLIAPIVASQSSDVAFIVSLAGPSLSGDKILLAQQKAIAFAKGKDAPEIEAAQQLNREAFNLVRLYEDADTLTQKMTAYIKEISLNDPDKPVDMSYEDYVNAQVNVVLNPWMINFLRYEPRDYISSIKCPVLALNGAKDLQVLASENLPEWKNILEKAGNRNVTTEELKNLNHLFQTCETGLPEEYEKLEESFSEVAMSKMTNWIKKQL